MISSIHCRSLVVAIVAVMVGAISVGPLEGQAGDHYVKKSSGSNTQPSSAIIDASVQSGSNICEVLYNALNSVSQAGVAIDARGVSTTTSCASSETPWQSPGNTTLTQPSILLLPAGTITSKATWQIPAGTRLVGMGSGSTKITTIKNTTSSTILQMGTSSCSPSPCVGVAVEHLSITGSSATSDAIYNNNAGQGSYVNDVYINSVQGIGVYVGSGALGSGPYSNITFDAKSGDSSSTVCLQILTSTLGVRGLNCTAKDTTPSAGIEVDGSNNTLEDITVTEFLDGIEVGLNGSASNNIIRNVTDFSNTATDRATVHIYSGVADLILLGIQNACGSTQGCHASTVYDEVTATQLSDLTLSMYVLGRASGSTGNLYSRFTTAVATTGSALAPNYAPNAPTWIVGGQNPPTTTGCSLGSLYSNTGTSGNSLWVCTPSSTTTAWVVVPGS